MAGVMKEPCDTHCLQELHVFNQVPRGVVTEATGRSLVLFLISIFNSHLEDSSCTVERLLKSCIRMNCGVSELV